MASSGFPLVGDLLWLDFVNTEPVLDGRRVDLLPDFDSLTAWLQATDALPDPPPRRPSAGSAEGRAVFREALGFRAALRAGAERMAAGKPPGAEMLRAVNRVLAGRPAVRELVREGTGWVSRIRPVTISARHLLVPIAESAAWLLEQGDPSLVRRCDGPTCVLLFYDTTRNRSRRWCSMDGCGSRAKAAAYYRRTRGG